MPDPAHPPVRPPRSADAPPASLASPAPALVGWKEYLDLPELGLRRLKAKIDTGARTSTLHVEAITYHEIRPGGGASAEITLSPRRRAPELLVVARVEILRHIRVIDSGGHPEVRPLIETEMVLGALRKRIYLTLTDRSTMLFRMILGRKAIAGDFRVDPAAKYLLRRRRGPGTPPAPAAPRDPEDAGHPP
jgi:hypothetical protein